jgi:hypothetical protein
MEGRKRFKNLPKLGYIINEQPQSKSVMAVYCLTILIASLINKN